MNNSEMHNAIDAARHSGKYMVALWYRENDELKQVRVTESFPVGDIPIAQEMLLKDFATLTVSRPDSTNQLPGTLPPKKS